MDTLHINHALFFIHIDFNFTPGVRYIGRNTLKKYYSLRLAQAFVRRYTKGKRNG